MSLPARGKGIYVYGCVSFIRERRARKSKNKSPVSPDKDNQCIKVTYQAEAQNHGTPKTDIVERLAAPNPFGALHHDDGQLQHLADEAVAANLLCDAGHDNLVADGGDEEGDEGGKGLAGVGARGAVDVAAQEGVDGDVPLARKLHPVGRVPPVGVEVVVGEAGDFGKGAEDVLEDDEEDEQKGEHKGEEQPGDCLGEDEAGFEDDGGRGRGGGGVEAVRGVDEDGQDVLLGGDCQEEDAAKGGDDLGDERGPVDGGVAGVLELVAERRAAQEVDVVGPGEVARVRDVANGARKLTGEVLAQLVDLVGAGGLVDVDVAVLLLLLLLLLLGLAVLLVFLVVGGL